MNADCYYEFADLDDNKVKFTVVPDSASFQCSACEFVSVNFPPSADLCDIGFALELHACAAHLNRPPDPGHWEGCKGL
jgi:hypothetical protein